LEGKTMADCLLLTLVRGARKGLSALSLTTFAVCAAAVPRVGDTVSEEIRTGVGRSIPLPPGTYKVHTAMEDGSRIDLMTLGPTGRGERVHLLTLVNTDARADIPLIVLDFSQGAYINWNSQPCDAADPQNPPLATQSFGTTSSSVVVKCQQVHAISDFRAAVRGARSSPSERVRKHLSDVSSLHAQLPNHALVVHGYVSRSPGDRVAYWLYLNPGRYGLDEPDGRPSVFRAPDGKDDRSRQAKLYLSTAAGWGESYLDVVMGCFLGGRSASHTVQELTFAGLRRAGEPSPAGPPAAVTSAVAATISAVVAAGSPSRRPGSPARPVLAAAPSASAQRVHALVIGNSAYPMARLTNPRNDATAIAERFRRFGFAVTLVLDATRQQFVKALKQFSDGAVDADVGIVFFAGHGMQVGGVNYLIPTDLDLSGTGTVSVPLEAVSLDSLLQEHLPGRTKLVFLDACRDNPLSRSLLAQRGGGPGLAPVQAASGTLISYATRDGGTSTDGDRGNSPYTMGLLAHMDADDDIALILRRVRQHVLKTTKGRQEPWEYGALVGDALVLSRVAR
jgi:hypothetical protein